jgi:hypothetical protein
MNIIAPQLSSSLMAQSVISDFGLATTPVTTLSGSTSSSLSKSLDVIYNVVNTPKSTTTATLNVNIPFGVTYTASYNNLTPSIANFTASTQTYGYITTGTASMNVAVGDRTKNIQSLISQKLNTTVALFSSYVTNSLAYNVYFSGSASISGLAPNPTTQNIYSSTNDITFTYVRNTSSWFGGINQTCVPVYSNTSGQINNGMLVTPDILICANHAPHNTGDILYFLDNNNTTISKSIVGTSNITGTDVLVARFSSSLSSSIKPARILPSASYQGHLVNLSTQAQLITQVPCVWFDQYRKVRIACINTMQFPTSFIYFSPPSGSSPFYPWYVTPIGGDSGAPLFFIINNELIAIGTLFTPANLPGISSFTSKINSTIIALGSTSSLVTMSLAAFPTYSQ